jgi:hypothetical protein
MGYSIDWLPDGRLLVTGDKLRRREPDGSMVTHAEQGGNEIVVDARGNIYVNDFDFDFVGGEAPRPGYIKREPAPTPHRAWPHQTLRLAHSPTPGRGQPGHRRYTA